MMELLYRALNKHEDTSAGIRPTDHSANLTVKEHVERGGFRVCKASQFISTTQDLKHALRWVSENRSALAIIFTRFLDARISLLDISKGYRRSSWKYDEFVKKHKEVLVQPFINPDAIWVCSYDDLVEIYHDRNTPSILQEMSPNGQIFFRSALSSQFSYRCSFCHGYGHDIKYDHYCVEFDDWNITEIAIQEYKSRYCYYCNEHGHDDSDCDEVALDNAIHEHESRYCFYCDKPGHYNYDCDEWALDNAIHEHESRYCFYCDKPGHYNYDCDEWALDNAIQEHESRDYCY